MEIRDGAYENSTLIGGRLCREELPASITSSKQELHLRFFTIKKSNEDHNVRRFRIKVIAEMGRKFFINDRLEVNEIYYRSQID